MPSEGGVLFAEGGRVPSQGVMLHFEDGIMPSECSIQPYDGDIMFRRAAFYIPRAVRRLQRTATLRGRHPTFGGRRVVRRGRQSTF